MAPALEKAHCSCSRSAHDRVSSTEGLLCPAANLSIAEIDDLATAVSFRAALIQGAEKVSVLVDRLDEVESSDTRRRWGQMLARLATRSAVDVVATMRAADWQSDVTLQKQLKNWREVSLQEWSEDLVRMLLAPTQFAQVLPPSLLRLLRTPIMLDLFWRTFVEAASDAPPRLPVTQHQLLAAVLEATNCERSARAHFRTMDAHPTCLRIGGGQGRRILDERARYRRG